MGWSLEPRSLKLFAVELVTQILSIVGALTGILVLAKKQTNKQTKKEPGSETMKPKSHDFSVLDSYYKAWLVKGQLIS